MGEITQMIDSIESNLNYPPPANKVKGLVLKTLEYNYWSVDGCSPEDVEYLRGFISVDSAFYPKLAEYYNEVCEEWYDEKLFEWFDDAIFEIISEDGGREDFSEPYKWKLLHLCKRYDLSPQDLLDYGMPEDEDEKWLANLEKKVSQLYEEIGKVKR